MKYFIFCVLTFSASIVGHVSANFHTVVWNVGQGQWVTVVTPLQCYHFDVGGEFFPWQKVASQCTRKKNFLFLSHWDWDHIGALSKPAMKKYLPDLCVALAPVGKSSDRKMRLVSSLQSCAQRDLFLSAHRWLPSTQGETKISPNALSSVTQLRGVLFPGDSTTAQEKLWQALPWVARTRFLILGHHGSATSTSESLLKHLSEVTMSVSSARWSRYRHPHSRTLARLLEARIPNLRTEDWGNIWIAQTAIYDFKKF